MTKRLVVSALGNRIYYARILKDGTMSDDKKDMTDDVIKACFQHLMGIAENNEKKQAVVRIREEEYELVIRKRTDEEER